MSLKDKLMKLPGVGSARAQELIDAGVNSVNDLRKKRFSPLLSDETLLYLKYPTEDTISWSRANELIEKLPSYLVGVGSYRRKKSVLHDIDLLSTRPLDVVAKDISREGDAYEVMGQYASGDKKHSMIIKFPKESSPPRYYRVDIFYADPENEPYALLHHTGSRNFNIRVRAHAKRQGYKLTQYGLVDLGTGKKIKLKTEKDILDFLGITYKKPEQRNE